MKIGIIGAMDVEVSLLKERMETKAVSSFAGREFCEGTIGQVPVVIVQSGVGKVNAAICTQLLIDQFAVTHILNTGVAGSLNNDINIGDIVISKEARHHDVDAQVFGYAPGEVPQLGIAAFPADESLRKKALEACRAAAPEIGVFEGTVLSGDQFISRREQKERIIEVFGGDCAEMEGAAIAQAAWINQVPFVIIRAISDKADESVQVSYEEFEGKAAVHCAKLVMSMLESLRSDL
ncbi:MAG: 5'-methylthioadenosine/adenosylhomocysteine nucleosidase [Lachnospiraceae bacterium]|nr:5'-methylthioadenosine/adenosylhomocysteine nucleosidase [Lachnospiraceae bacterium]